MMASPELRLRQWPGSGPTLVGHVLEGRYELLDLIGRGGMAEVYKAHFIPGGTHCAIKLLRQGSAADSELTRRFTREFRALHQLDHPGIVRARDFGLADDERPYFAMELLVGETLHDVFERDPRLDPARAVRIALQVCEALQALHDAGIVHRDLKPGNLFLQEDDRVKLIDLGIARLTDAYYARDGRYVTPPARRIRTPAAHILGTPGYIAPEIRQQSAGPGADVFALGVVLYQMLTGEVAFHASDTAYATPAPGALDSLPRSLRRTVLTAIELEPDERYQSVRELQMDLEDALLDVSSESELHQLQEPNETRPTKTTPPRLSWPMIFSLGVLLGATVASALPEIRSSTEKRRQSPNTDAPMPAAKNPPVVEAVTREPGTDSPRSIGAPVTDPPTAQPDDVEALAKKATEPTLTTTPEPAEKPTRARTKRPRVPASFKSKMDRARPAMAACFRFLATGDETSITVRVHNGSPSIKARGDWPTSVHRCLERSLSTLDFDSRSFSATYRMKP